MLGWVGWFNIRRRGLLFLCPQEACFLPTSEAEAILSRLLKVAAESAAARTAPNKGLLQVLLKTILFPIKSEHS